MQQAGNTRELSQRAVQNHRNGFVPLGRKSTRRAGRAENASSASLANSFGFLNTRFEDLGMNDDTLIAGYGLNVVSGYDKLSALCARFLKHYKVDFDFKPTNDGSFGGKLQELTAWFDEKIKPFGLELAVVKHDKYDSENHDVDFVVYSWIEELEQIVVIMYCSPAHYLSPKGAELFKKFMKYVSSSMCVPVGANEDNYHIDGVLEMIRDEAEADPDFEQHADDTMFTVANQYKSGKFKELFEEIKSLPEPTPSQLIKELEQYRKQCPTNEMDLVECMIDGVPIIGRMNVHGFDFNPDDSGLPSSEDWDNEDGWLSSPLTTAIVYSENDGVGELLLENVNCYIQNGVGGYGWHSHLYLSERMTDADMESVVADKEAARKFSYWISDFYEETKKFDLYGK